MISETETSTLLDPQPLVSALQRKLSQSEVFQDTDVKQVPSFRFFKIHKTFTYQPATDTNYNTIEIVDLSCKPFEADLKQLENSYTFVNSAISHEMRNPLNAITN